MNTPHEDRNEDHGQLRAYWRARLQDYVDGTLPEKQALRLHLFVQEDPVLAAELAETRGLFRALDQIPRQIPGPDFDAEVLERVPHERYASSPRRPDRVLVLGEERPVLPVAVGRSLRRAAFTAVIAWGLVVAVSHSFLQRTVVLATSWLGEQLAALAARTESVPVLSSVVGLMHRGYDALVAATGTVSGLLGGGVLLFLIGVGMGGLVLRVHIARRRRIDGRRAPAS
jgi:anti-sigma factor RsiW